MRWEGAIGLRKLHVIQFKKVVTVQSSSRLRRNCPQLVTWSRFALRFPTIFSCLSAKSPLSPLCTTFNDRLCDITTGIFTLHTCQNTLSRTDSSIVLSDAKTSQISRHLRIPLPRCKLSFNATAVGPRLSSRFERYGAYNES